MPLTSLGLVQFLAAAHLFAHRVCTMRVGYFPHHAFPHWAPGWYPFLFAAEGFRLTHAQLTERGPSDAGPVVHYLCKQLARLYPTYFVSIALLALTPGRVHWDEALVNVVPVFTWTGATTDRWRAAWNGGAWQLSDLAFHLVCWRFTFPRMAALSQGSCWCVLCASLSLTYARILGFALGLETEMVMWAPYTFGHFFCGMCLASLFVARGGADRSEPRDRLALEVWPHRLALSGVLALLMPLAVLHWGPHPDAIHAVAPFALWLGALMPLQLLAIWMLALEEGPLARLGRWGPLAWAGDAGRALLLLQWNAAAWVSRSGHRLDALPLAGRGKFALVLLPAAAALAAAAHLLAERPLRRLAAAADGCSGPPRPRSSE